MNINIPIRQNKKLEKILIAVNNDIEIESLLRASNINAIDRLGFNDHGKVHVAIVSNISLKLFSILKKMKMKFNIVKDYNMSNDDAEVVVFLASVFHDIGHAIHRQNHDEYSLLMARPIIERILDNVYTGEEKYIMLSEILHAMISHAVEYKPLTIEGSIVRIADALDMKQGRARIPYKMGETNIHSFSALAIKDVKIEERRGKKPILIKVIMSNHAGMFQIDELLRKKISNSKLEGFITVKVLVDSALEKKTKEEFRL